MENEKKTATSNAEMVTISRAEYESQQAQLTELKLQNQWLLEQLGLAKKREFGSSSERIREELMDQLAFSLNEAEAYAYGTKSATPEQIAVKAHARKRQSGSVTDIVPEGTPTEVVEHRLSNEERICASCGTVMEEIGKEVHRSLQMEPARFWVREDVYYTYACKKCEEETGEANILKTPKQPVLCPGSFASAEAVAHIMTQKFVMYSPLYRLEQEFNREGLKLSRQTMANWMLNTSDTWLRPIYDVLHRNLCKEPVLHGDETTLQVLKESGKAAASKSYMWLYRTSGCAESPIVLYPPTGYYGYQYEYTHHKTFLGNRSMRVYTGDALEGKMLIAFVALIIRNRMYTKLKDEEEKLLSSPNFMNVPAAIRELEKIEMIRQADGVYRLDHAVTANQKIILKAFGIDANYIKRKAEQISNELNPKVLKVKINGRKS